MESGFEKDYWDKNYGQPSEMDGIGNVKEHVGYIKNLLGLDYIDVSSVVDLGFGLGYLFQAVLKEFRPHKAYGVEPSRYAFDLVKQRKIKPVESMKLKLENCGIVAWCKNSEKIKTIDLGICTSVFQYLTEEEIDFVLPILAQKVRYLYFSVPTDKELKRQIEDLDFHDEFAIRRSRAWYQKNIKKYFTIVSARMLESKIHFDEETTSFTDLLFRF